MSYEIRELREEDFPPLLFQIEDPPEQLFIAGKMPSPESKFLCVVGSRKYSGYGKEVCERLIEGLRGQNIVIVSGLAMGMDSLAHEAALKNNLKTIAVPGSGLHPDVIYPRTNFYLAQKIVDSGGALLSEYEERFKATLWGFPKRNRIEAGMCHATLIIEAEEKSGTLITARLAMEYNRSVCVVPGDIFSKNSMGSNQLIKDGARPILKSEDILEELDIKSEIKNLETIDISADEKRILEFLSSPISKEELLENLEMETSKVNILLSSMEIRGIIKETYGKIIVNE